METKTTIPYDTDMEEGVSNETLQEMLAHAIGKYVLCELLIGLRALTMREGILTEVGRDYFILQDPVNPVATTCDIYSLKFVTMPIRTAQTGQTAGQPFGQCPAGAMQQIYPTTASPQGGKTQQGFSQYNNATWYRLE